MFSYLRGTIALAIALGSASVSFAAPIVNTRPGAVAVQPGSEQSVQSIFNHLFVSGAPSVANGQSNMASFRPTSATVFTYLDGIAGFRGSNIFGIYETLGAAERIVFNGSQPNGTEVSGNFSPSAQIRDFMWFLDVRAADGDTSDIDYRMWSSDALNPGGLPQMLVFAGNGQQFLNSAIGVDGIFNTNDIIIAFEDLNRSVGSDDDFNDLIVLIENINPGQPIPPDPDFEVVLPEPASLFVWSLMAGAGGVFAWRKKRRNAV